MQIRRKHRYHIDWQTEHAAWRWTTTIAAATADELASWFAGI